MAISQSLNLKRKRKAGDNHYKHIIQDAELQDACNEKHRKQYAMAEQTKNGKKPSQEVIEAQRLRWRTQKQIQKT